MTKIKSNYEEGFSLNEVLPVFCDEQRFRRYRVFIDEEITDPSKYRNVVNILDKAGEEDVVEFRLNTPGGNVQAALGIINAIKNTEATTVAVVEGIVASAGTFIMLACDRVIVTYNSLVMCHPAQYGVYGDMKVIKHQTEAWDKWLRNICHDSYQHFMTVEEIDDMIESSKEIWMDTEELIRRLKIRQEKLSEEDEQPEVEGENLPVTPPPTNTKRVARKAAKKTSSSK